MRVQPATPLRGLSNCDLSTAFCQQRQKNEPMAEQKETTDGEAAREMVDGFHKLLLLLHTNRKRKRKKGCCNLLPTETNISHFEPVIAVIVEILCMNCSIPHHLQ